LSGVSKGRRPLSTAVDGDVQEFCAYGVDNIVTVARSRPPQDAGDKFPVIRSFIHWRSMDRGPMELLIVFDNT
jgi:hypothetical protein